MQAPIGSPPPSPLASVITFGLTSSCCQAQSAPVRPMPHWTSSMISRAPCSSQAVRAVRSISRESGWMPDSPWITSRITAAVLSSTACPSASGSSRGTTLNPGTSGAKGACFSSWGVAESEPIVRPWKPPSSTTKSPPCRRLRASLIAHSFASVPELQRNARPPSELSTSRFASRIAGSV